MQSLCFEKFGAIDSEGYRDISSESTETMVTIGQPIWYNRSHSLFNKDEGWGG